MWSIKYFDAGIWGTRSFSSIDDIFHRACRFFLGVGKQAPLAAVTGDMGLIQLTCRQALAVTRLFNRLCTMSTSRLNRKVFMWPHLKRGVKSRGWFGRVSRMFSNIRLPDLVDFERCENINLITANDHALNTFKNEWSAKVNRIQTRSGRGCNKLRTYSLSMVWNRMFCV